MIFDKIKKMQGSFEEWHWLCQNSRKGTDLYRFSFQKMLETARTVEELTIIFEYSPGKAVKVLVFEKIINLTEDFEGLYELCSRAWPGDKDPVIEKILTIKSGSFEDLRKIFYLSHYDRHKEAVLSEALKKATTPEEFFWIRQVSKRYKNIQEEAQKLLENSNQENVN